MSQLGKGIITDCRNYLGKQWRLWTHVTDDTVHFDITTVGAVIYLKSLLDPNITASTSVGCRDTSPICVNASRSTSGDSNTSIEIRLNK